MSRKGKTAIIAAVLLTGANLSGAQEVVPPEEMAKNIIEREVYGWAQDTYGHLGRHNIEVTFMSGGEGGIVGFLATVTHADIDTYDRSHPSTSVAGTYYPPNHDNLVSVVQSISEKGKDPTKRWEKKKFLVTFSADEHLRPILLQVSSVPEEIGIPSTGTIALVKEKGIKPAKKGIKNHCRFQAVVEGDQERFQQSAEFFAVQNGRFLEKGEKLTLTILPFVISVWPYGFVEPRVEFAVVPRDELMKYNFDTRGLLALPSFQLGKQRYQCDTFMKDRVDQRNAAIK